MNFTGHQTKLAFCSTASREGPQEQLPPITYLIILILGFQGVVVSTAFSYQHLTNWFHQTEYNMHTLGQTVVSFQRNGVV